MRTLGRFLQMSFQSSFAQINLQPFMVAFFGASCVAPGLDRHHPLDGFRWLEVEENRSLILGLEQ